MNQIRLTKGLDIPITGEPKQHIAETVSVTVVGLLGDDYIGMKPTMEVAEGDHVKTGQLLFRDKRNEGVCFTSPATGKVTTIKRGAKRKFDSIAIQVDEDDFVSFVEPREKNADNYTKEEIREVLLSSSLWTSFRTRPYGKVPASCQQSLRYFYHGNGHPPTCTVSSRYHRQEKRRLFSWSASHRHAH